LVERRFATILNGRYSRSFTPPSVTFRMMADARTGDSAEFVFSDEEKAREETRWNWD
jgi:hypothetical protein